MKEAFETHFPNTPVPAETTITQLVNNFFAKGSVANAPKVGRPKMATTAERVEEVRAPVETDTTDILSSPSKENDNFSIRLLLYM